MRISARRRRAAATISIARVIFWMFLTEAILFLTSRCEAISYLRPAQAALSASSSGWPSSSRS